MCKAECAPLGMRRFFANAAISRLLRLCPGRPRLSAPRSASLFIVFIVSPGFGSSYGVHEHRGKRLLSLCAALLP
eukprot:4148262-Pleurochrysis_carterae.AAC.2